MTLRKHTQDPTRKLSRRHCSVTLLNVCIKITMFVRAMVWVANLVAKGNDVRKDNVSLMTTEVSCCPFLGDLVPSHFRSGGRTKKMVLLSALAIVVGMPAMMCCVPTDMLCVIFNKPVYESKYRMCTY